MHGHADDSGLMTVNEVAEYFRVCASTIWRWLHEGKLSSVKIGYSRRFRREDMMRMAGAEPDLVAESGPTYGGAGDYTAVTSISAQCTEENETDRYLGKSLDWGGFFPIVLNSYVLHLYYMFVKY